MIYNLSMQYEQGCDKTGGVKGFRPVSDSASKVFYQTIAQPQHKLAMVECANSKKHCRHCLANVPKSSTEQLERREAFYTYGIHNNTYMPFICDATKKIIFKTKFEEAENSPNVIIDKRGIRWSDELKTQRQKILFITAMLDLISTK